MICVATIAAVTLSVTGQASNNVILQVGTIRAFHQFCHTCWPSCTMRQTRIMVYNLREANLTALCSSATTSGLLATLLRMSSHARSQRAVCREYYKLPYSKHECACVAMLCFRARWRALDASNMKVSPYSVCCVQAMRYSAAFSGVAVRMNKGSDVNRVDANRSCSVFGAHILVAYGPLISRCLSIDGTCLLTGICRPALHCHCRFLRLTLTLSCCQEVRVGRTLLSPRICWLREHL
jgi:hypothetical protein